MSSPSVELGSLSGQPLVTELERRFDTSVEEVDVGPRSISILRPRNSDDLIREEDFVMDERLPYWADIWPSSRILAAQLLSPESPRPASNARKGLELGCGVGLVTTAAILAGYEMIATDYYTDALEFTRANAWRNTGATPATCMINWRAFPAGFTGFDLILASDVLYEKEYAALLPGIFRTALAPGGMVILADPGRIGVPVFLESCETEGLVIRGKPEFPREEGEVRQRITLYEVAREGD